MLESSASLTTHPFSSPKPQRTHHQLNLIKRGHVAFGIRCCSVKRSREAGPVDYYQLLGVSVDSTPKEIKEAYRRLQKKYHPDIAGQKGHEHALMLNEAYHALIREDLRSRYNVSSGKKREGFESNFSGLGYSSWNGPMTPHALFVDENKCIGCRECVHHASKTFTMDEALGCARVRVQFGDHEKDLEVAIESCPMNCIHWVESEELPQLEFLIRPQPKEARGVFGGGWERPRDVFAAAQYFNKQLKQKEEQTNRNNHNGTESTEDETAAQAKARYDASLKLRLETFIGTWSWLREFFSSE